MQKHTHQKSGIATNVIPSNPTTPDIQAKWNLIDKINFDNIEMKLVLSQPEGNNLSKQEAKTAITWYKRYLKLHVKYPNQSLVPNHSIDTVWHHHILDTRAYAQDCNAVFGQMLHHYPYLGLNDDIEERDTAFEETDILYMSEFGQSCKDGHPQNESASMCNGGGGD